ncbi:1-aminocyclopropane-1-carboxylate deaminase [Allofrancisella guangzhouensis]|uniref:1-aminocyclopropane-1-carboxylate deaminase n=1 Tax=Allofrancisella guangzhouensis TaxID=594679 RepID=A0A0A8E5N0_9GAMM|nr:1-aminocyclopropane-1-carboxylate deaminase [Allofrancisella guangzhouensis]AJC49269.1 1-aminocyclopropane-1-carboxylate deaminase [Allofrancisella guangzhouensis]MBK2027712.1 1-aminocyclopropane-1-carboxylate deaminase [Allofrancisella guangzhouensis]MBK2044874.1 1-aminocyclopropane-1-carboxylate deaminase [Allofrancisella guangzhouensis]MBK2046399.1 1-aminocyclopropane-1-carboxylate deaminase [Allofrancisella guangzhouensis]
MPSLFQKITFDDKHFIVMRDDLNHPIFSGNKARKLAYILKNPEKYSHIKTIVSFGGNQSNFMLALSQLSKLNNWQFHYWVKPLPKFLKQHQNGNFKLALNNNMQLFETQCFLNLENIKLEYTNSKDIYFFDQGGRHPNAETGIVECANEIAKYCKENNFQDYSVIVASGTGATALYLEKHLPNKVYTVACVGNEDYLKEQFFIIDPKQTPPMILVKNFKSTFGQLDIDNYKLYKKLLEQTDIEFDLLYDPITWRVLLKNYNQLPKPIIYIHCGGTSGNITMLSRYNRIVSYN